MNRKQAFSTFCDAWVKRRSQEGTAMHAAEEIETEVDMHGKLTGGRSMQFLLTLLSVAFMAIRTAGCPRDAMAFCSEDPRAEERVDIAVPVLTAEPPFDYLVAWLDGHGFNTCLITSAEDIDPEEYAGLVLPGGGDVDPSLYGQEENSRDFGIHRRYDEMEMELVHRFAEAGKPILGICRGCQLINVAFGGTLEQDIPVWHKAVRRITLSEDSLLYRYYGRSADVFHIHHQCIDRLADHFTAIEWDAEDKRIEAIRHEDLPIYGLQWHPEYSGGKGEAAAEMYLYMCRQEENEPPCMNL